MLPHEFENLAILTSHSDNGAWDGMTLSHQKGHWETRSCYTNRMQNQSGKISPLSLFSHPQRRFAALLTQKWTWWEREGGGRFMLSLESGEKMLMSRIHRCIFVMHGRNREGFSEYKLVRSKVISGMGTLDKKAHESLLDGEGRTIYWVMQPKFYFSHWFCLENGRR